MSMSPMTLIKALAMEDLSQPLPNVKTDTLTTYNVESKPLKRNDTNKRDKTWLNSLKNRGSRRMFYNAQTGKLNDLDNNKENSSVREGVTITIDGVNFSKPAPILPLKTPTRSEVYNANKNDHGLPSASNSVNQPKRKLYDPKNDNLAITIPFDDVHYNIKSPCLKDESTPKSIAKSPISMAA